MKPPSRYNPHVAEGASENSSIGYGSDELLKALWREYPERLRRLRAMGHNVVTL